MSAGDGAEPAAVPGRRRRAWGLAAGAAVGLLLLALPPPAGLSAAAWRTAAVGLVMALWWMTEAIPIAATSLLPLALFPLLGVAAIDAAAAPYAHPLVFLFLGGFLLALALERWNLHRRIALEVVRRVGGRPVRLVAGFMLASAFLSMWISNTATAMLMLPIGLSLVELVRGEAAGPPAAGERGSRFALCLMLGIAYACSLGGMATLIGTPTNDLLAAFVADTYGRQVTFLEWLAVGLPLVAVGLPLVYWMLTRVVYRVRVREIPGGREFLAAELARLGRPRPAEKRVAVVFAFTALAWVTRPLLAAAIPGLSDTGVALLGALALFVLPAGDRSGRFLLDWEATRRLPWGVLLLFGGGLSLAAAVRQTGLAEWIGERLRAAGELPGPVLLLLAVATILLLTELTSNTATAAAFLPVLASLAAATGQPPMRLLVAAALAASGAFMLPVATPPNAIVYGSGYVTIPQMVRAGAPLNLLFLLLITAFAYLLVPWIFPG